MHRFSRRRTAALFLPLVSAASLAAQFIQVPGVGWEGQGAASVLVNLDENPRPELLLLAYDHPNSRPSTFRYRVVPNVSEDGVGTRHGSMIEVPGFGVDAGGIGAAAARIDADPRPDLVLMAQRTNGTAYWKIGFNLDRNGRAARWSGVSAVGMAGAGAQGGGVTIGNIDSNPRPDVVFAMHQPTSSGHRVLYRIVWNLSSTGAAGGYGPVRAIAMSGTRAQGSDVALADIDRNGRPDLLCMAYVDYSGGNAFQYRIARDLSTSGVPASLSGIVQIGGVGSLGQGAGVAVADLGGSALPELLLMAYDNPSTMNSFRYKVVRDANPARIYPGQDITGRWRRVHSLWTQASPAIAHHGGAVHTVAIGRSGNAWTSATTRPDTFSSWRVIPGTPGGGLATTTSPVLVNDGGTLLGFARGRDGSLYRTARRPGASAFDAWQRVALASRVTGRIDVAITRSSAGVHAHVVHTSASGGVEYTVLRNWQRVATHASRSALDGAVAADDGDDRACVVFRLRDRLLIDTAAELDGWRVHRLTQQLPSGTGVGQMLDLSNVVHYGDAFHVLYAQRYRIDDVLPREAWTLTHNGYRLGRGHVHVAKRVTSYTPSGPMPARARLAVYRSKLVAAWALPTGALHFARLDNADPRQPWVGHVSALGAAAGRPALVSHSARSSVRDWSAPSYGDDLFAAIQGNAATAPVWLAVLSRVVMKQELAAQFRLYDSNSDHLSRVCQRQSDPWGPTPVDMTQDHRAFVSELGANVWMFPDWFARGLYRRMAQSACTIGNTSGRYDPPCNAVRAPVIVKRRGGIFVCSGAWVNDGGNWLHIWEELGHQVASALGFHDNSRLPTQRDAVLSNISLIQLLRGAGLFNERVRSCRGGPRCRGFTGYGNNYDAGSRQHSFIYLIYYYLSRGDQLRRFIREDVAAGDTLLQRKYEWVRDVIFRGVEFRGAMQPLRTGTLAVFGRGCRGSNGVPSQTATAPAGGPRPGTTTRYHLTSAPVHRMAFLWLGNSARLWAPYRLPLDLGFIGAPGCQLLNNSTDLIGTLTDRWGRATVPVKDPLDVALVGARRYTQFLCFDDANALGLTFSNGVATTLGAVR